MIAYYLTNPFTHKRDIFNAKNHPDAIESSQSGTEVSWEDHCSWWYRFFDNSNNGFLYLGVWCNHIEFIGYVRIEEKQPGTYELSWFLYPEFRKCGYMTAALEKIFEDYPNRYFFATVHKDNMPSRKLAEKFFDKCSGDDWLVYRN
jgi:RimJ/RimL family protein N-acetyltransferase